MKEFLIESFLSAEPLLADLIQVSGAASLLARQEQMGSSSTQLPQKGQDASPLSFIMTPFELRDGMAMPVKLQSLPIKAMRPAN